MIFYCCTSTHMRMHDQSAYDELHGLVEGETAKIVLMNDDVILGENIFMGVDSTSLVVVEQWKTYSYVREWDEIGEICSIPTSDVKKIDIVSRGQGALGGLYYGFIVGASLGAIFGIIIISGGDDAGGRYDLPAIGGGTDDYILTKIPEDSKGCGS